MSSCRVAVVVPASGVRAESPKCTVIRSIGTPSTSDCDLGERRCLAAADVSHPASHGQAPVELESDPGGGGVVQPDKPAVGLDVGGDPAPHGLTRPGRHRRRARPVKHRVDRLRQEHLSLDHLADRQGITARQGVPLPDVGGRDLKFTGEKVHLRLVAENHLHSAKAAKGRRRRVVRVRAAGPQPHVVHPVGTAGVHRRVQEHQRRKVSVRAGIGGDVDLLAENRPVPAGRGAIPQPHAVALRARQQRLLPCPVHADRTPGPPDGEGEIRLDGHVLLAAEAPSDIGRDHPHPGLRYPENPRHVPVVLDDLRGDAEIQYTFVIEPAHPRLRLEVGVVDGLRL